MSKKAINPTISALLNHRTIRKFKPDAIPKEQIHAIIDSAQAASSSSHMQAYSIIGITDSKLKSEIGRLCGPANQAFIEQCPIFLVWCADLFRLDNAIQRVRDLALPNTINNFLTAAVDTALAAQNAAVAAESLGLGIVYVGGIRNKPREVSDLLHLPELVFPVFGMAIGIPDQAPLHRPRLDRKVIYHENSYSSDNWVQGIDQYDELHKAYSIERSGGTDDITWSKRMVWRISQPESPLLEFLHDQGFKLT